MCAIMDEIRAEGMEEGMKKGMEEGMEKGRAGIIEGLLRKGYTTEQISAMLDIQLNEIKEIEKKIKQMEESKRDILQKS